jgi:5'-3' exoribonuclease 2
MCFLLGNDFLPHFPSLNIRTHGNTTILETYKRVIGTRVDRRFIGIETGNIQWRWVKVFLTELAKEEPRSILAEYESRHKMEKRFYPTTKKEERETAFDNIPTIYRAEEHYINPKEPGWESRYYRVAFHLEGELAKPFVESVCTNYLEGLEWVFRYYTEGCPHWRWKYAFHYPPLFRDLVAHVPDFETTFIDERKGINKPFHPYTQLCYVIPKWNHEKVLPKKALKCASKYDYLYVGLNELKFQWMFCRYFWESHAILPEMTLYLLE